MGRVPRRLLVAGAICAVLFVVLPWAVSRLVNVEGYKPAFERAASDSLGMEIRIGGRMRLLLFPGIHVTLADVRVLDEGGDTVASSARVSLWIAPLPLLRRELRLSRLDLSRPRITIARDSTGRYGLAKLKRSVRLLRTLDGASVSVSDGTVVYEDGRTGERIVASGLGMSSKRIRLARRGNPLLPADAGFEAVLTCDEIRTRRLVMSAVRIPIELKEGVLVAAPATLKLFGGEAKGSLHAELGDSVPSYRLAFRLDRFRVDESLATLSPVKVASGAMDFSTSLTFEGTTRERLMATMAGVASLRGADLTLFGNDLDLEISRFESSQNFNLVDVGAIFVAGPFGLAVTRGYSFASLFRGTGGTSRIAVLVSDWKVEGGTAWAQDVALSTSRNRIALRGGLDLVNNSFQDVTMAVVDERGCAAVRQSIRGSFAAPAVEKPHLLQSMAGPLMNLARRTRALLPAGTCEAFYSGSVPPPA